MNLHRVSELLIKNDLTQALYFVRKKKEGYISYSPEVDPTIFGTLREYIRSYIEDFQEYEQVEFNPTGYRDGTIETCNIDYVGNFEEVIGSLDIGNVEDAEEEADNFSFYCLSLEDNEGNSIKLFRRVTKFKRLYSKGLIAAFHGNMLNRIDSKMLGLDGQIDIIVFEDEIAILSHVALERIFRLNEQFVNKAQTAIDRIRCADKIINMDLFEEDCMNDMRIQKVLTKMLKEENDLENCFDNFSNVVETIELFELQVEIQAVPREGIIYEHKGQLMDIIRLARDSYYMSLIKEKPGIDNKI
ncbi:Kiwa anti-phage protein KwaB-like domain-containing protein [Lacrimispora indolis]|uniref:Kiwa anti-phage protein KwaB-like domain-containing protein n=1 Tax=Lacrimispora indolis TaxID=69825 RepID=UPI00045EA58D|nr:Kiwa anti-phage protein KwaB-like domain-containing protein [Lacrimispora indolis]